MKRRSGLGQRFLQIVFSKDEYGGTFGTDPIRVMPSNPKTMRNT